MNQKAEATLDPLHLNEMANQIDSWEGFLIFLRNLLREFQQRPDQWENRDVAAFLSAMAAWVEDMEGYYQNQGEFVPAHPTWKTLAEILLAARVYE